MSNFLFEIHDILLHRMWKMARRNYYAVVDGSICRGMTRQEFHNWVKLVRERYKLMKLTERWYMSHVHKLPKKGWLRALVDGDWQNAGKDLKNIYINKALVTKVTDKDNLAYVLDCI